VGYVAKKSPRHQASQFYFGYLREAVGIFESAIGHLKHCDHSQCEVADATDMAHRIKGNAAMYNYADLGLQAGQLEALLRSETQDGDHANAILAIIHFIDSIQKICQSSDNDGPEMAEPIQAEPIRLLPTLAITANETVSQSPVSTPDRKSIFVAYKDSWLCDFVASLLEPEFSVISCTTKDDLFRETTQGPRGLILLENNFCDESGVDILRQLRSEYQFQDLPVYLAFDTDTPEDIAEAISLGVDGFSLDKLEILEVVNSVRNLLSKTAARALIVDDDPVVQQLLSQCLESAGLDVDTANDGLEALNYLSQNTPDIILLDRFMPRLEGGTVLYEIQSKINLKSIPVLILTSMVNQGEAKSWFERGAADFIPKPFDPEEVLMRVKKHLDIKGAL
jgi:DNA-binding response OmpR family regulator/HPt (histidine-containing phosphotransfer) domain-containing protein